MSAPRWYLRSSDDVPESGVFPFAKDWRNPNTSWTGGDKAAFLICYALFWVLVCIIVHFWSKIVIACRRLKSNIGFGARALRMRDQQRAPLVEDVSELCSQSDHLAIGPTPAYPADRICEDTTFASREEGFRSAAMFDFDELSGEEEAEEAKTVKKDVTTVTTSATVKLASPSPQGTKLQNEGGQGLTEVLVRHAIHGWELAVSLPRDASFAHLKRALAKRFLEDAEASFSGQLVKKEGGSYCSYKDSMALGQLREVLLAGFEPKEAPSQGEKFLFEEIDTVRDSKPDRSLDSFIALQRALRSGFAEAKFQEQLYQLKEQCEKGELKKTKFLEQRQQLFLTVQSEVLPKFGYEGTSLGVYKMMGDMKPYVQEPDFVVLADEINALLGIDYSPPDTWTALSDSCQKLNDEKDVRRFAPEARRPKQDQRRHEFRPPLGLLGPVGVPSLMSGKPLRLPDSILQGHVNELSNTGRPEGGCFIRRLLSALTRRRVIELFEEQAKARPAATALIVPSAGRSSKEITYKEMAACVDEVADTLLSLGISCGSVVALVMDRSVAQVVAVYGTLKAGAAFLPVDNDAPLARKQFLLHESEAAAMIAVSGDEVARELATEIGCNFIALPADGSRSGLQLLRRQRSRAHSFASDGEPGTGPSGYAGGYRRPEASDMALLIYTSGTTGAPKGIVYDHEHLMHGVYFFGSQCQVDSTSVAMLKSPYFWAIIEWEMFPALTQGGKLVVASANGHKSPEYLANTIAAEEVSVFMVTPQVLDLVLDVHDSQGNARPLRSVKHIVTVGEPLGCAVANRLVRTRGVEAQLHNFYGASESSCTVYTVPKEGIDLDIFPSKAPCGRPQPHAKVFVMREEAQESGPPVLVQVPGGEAGEICFGGVLAACYWKHDELTAQKWIDTKDLGRLYRTGDMGRWRAGQLEVIGRVDRQVKIRGVRVEPEEVEAVLRRYHYATSEDAGPSGLELGGPRPGLKEVAVVASKEPAELVAFVSLREGLDGAVTPDTLRAHCQANLTPSYVPKFFVILQELPKLPNGKSNLKQLAEMATDHVVEEGEVVMDSLGQMKKLSKWAIFENQVIHRCYAWWMIGVLTDHYMRCAIDMDKDNQYYPFCTTLARTAVRPWSEILVRSLGNDQDLFGFIMLGAYQDSRPATPGGPPSVKFGMKDFFVFIVYMAMALPLPQILHFIFREYAWPIDWGGMEPTNEWGWSYMQVNSYTSDHRWYLGMVFCARLYLEICERIQVPGWLQGILATIPCILPDSAVEGPGRRPFTFNICQSENAQTYVMWTFSWIFRNFGTGCPMYMRWVSWYLAFYVWSFHYLRPAVALLSKRLPKGPTWSAAALGCSMFIGVLMALFHYPNNVLEKGTGMAWAWLEIGVDILQPTLFVLGMTYVPVDLAWWGNTTLGAYVFHFYFRDHVAVLTMSICDGLAWDQSGLLVVAVILLLCLVFTTFLGPVGHYILLSPTLLYSRIHRILNRS
ncbi:tycA [Symbiodinium sp. CCMP2456]|nr:tycA [Symbiodinium sp. CCMP2456]